MCYSVNKFVSIDFILIFFLYVFQSDYKQHYRFSFSCFRTGDFHLSGFTFNFFQNEQIIMKPS